MGWGLDFLHDSVFGCTFRTTCPRVCLPLILSLSHPDTTLWHRSDRSSSDFFPNSRLISLGPQHRPSAQVLSPEKEFFPFQTQSPAHKEGASTNPLRNPEVPASPRQERSAAPVQP